MPTPAGGGGTARGRSTTTLARRTWFEWTEAKVDRLRTTTSTDPKATDAKPLSPEEHVRHCLGMDEAALRADPRPTLVYFHWPHEDPVDGKRFATLCLKVLDDEQVERVHDAIRRFLGGSRGC